MSTTVKWILGIVIGLIVIAAVVAFGFLLFNRWSGTGVVMGYHTIRPFDGGRVFPRLPYGGFPNQRFGSFFPLGLFIARLIWPVFLILIVVAGILLLLGLLRARRTPVTSVPAATAPAPAQTPETSKTCPNCERPVQEDWSHCPYCGTNLS